MADFEASLFVNADAKSIFDFVSDVRNMPQYLPTTHRAEPQGEGRVRVQGEAQGHPYDSDGWLKVDRTEYRMSWGSDGETRYSGWIEVDGDDGGSEVVAHLSFEPRPDQEERFREQAGDRDRVIREGLQAALQSIKNIVEGNGAKVEPASAQ